MDSSCYNHLHAHVVEEPGEPAAVDKRKANLFEFIPPFDIEMPFMGLDFGSFPYTNGGDFADPLSGGQNTLQGNCDDGTFPPLDFKRIPNFDLVDSFPTPPSSISEEPSSPELFSSSRSVSPASSSPLDLCGASTPPPIVDYTPLQASLDPELHEPFYTAIHEIGNGQMPPKEVLQKFVILGSGRFFCAFNGCQWHRIGWKREDRGISHVQKDHFKLISYPCQCGKVYRWPHDLKKHRQRKHPEAGEPRAPTFMCSVPGCTSTFDKKFNLDRHRKKVHKKGTGSRAAAARA